MTNKRIAMHKQLMSLKKDIDFIYKTRTLEEGQEDLDEVVHCQYHIQDTLRDMIDELLQLTESPDQIKANALCYALHQALTSPNIEVAIEGTNDNPLAQYVQVSCLARECVKAYDELDDDMKKLCFWWNESYRCMVKDGM